MIASQTIKRPAQTLLTFRLRPPTAGRFATVSIPNGSIAIITVVAAGTPRHIAANHIHSANNPAGMISTRSFCYLRQSISCRIDKLSKALAI